MEKKKNIGSFIFVTLISFTLPKACPGADIPSELDIERAGTQSDAPHFYPGIDLGNGLFKKTFLFPPSIAGPADSNSSEDPFASSNTNANIVVHGKEHMTPKKILEEMGVTFGKGASASIDPKTHKITLINTRDQIKRFEAFFASTFFQAEKQLAISVEIYEAPSVMALAVINSAVSEDTHAPERNALRKIAGQGQVKLVNTLTLIARSGQSATIEDSYDFPFPLLKTSSVKKEKEGGTQQGWEIRKIGTVFEIEPVLGANNFTIDLKISLAHHTADPEQSRAGPDYPPNLHGKKITTQITTHDRGTILIGSWKPTGKPEYEKNDLMHLVFISANAQTPTAPTAIVE